MSLSNAQRATIEERIATLDSLMTSPGWKIYLQMMEASKMAIYTTMQESPSSEIAKHFGAYNAINDLMTWPARERQLLVHRLLTEGKGSTASK